MTFQGQQCPQQLLVGLESFQGFRICDQLRQAITIESVFFDDLDRVLRKELADLVEPGHQCQFRGVERTGTQLLTQPATFIFATVQVLERLVTALILTIQSAGHPPLGVSAQNQTPTGECIHERTQEPRPSASRMASRVWDKWRFAISCASPTS